MTTSDPLVGATLDRRYFVESRIAGGGMATVYVAHDLRLDRRQALKVMHPSLAQDPSFVQRFINEAHSVAKLSHPNVVQVFDQGEDNGHVFLAMEYVPGHTLRDLLRERGRMASRDALNVMASVLAALGAAHQAGMVHRDVKPENVLIGKDGRVKVADFGLARAVEQRQQGLTRTGTLMGTAAYLAPEQIEKGIADARSDVYAAGIMLYELLTGGQPHTGETPIAIAYQHVNEDVPRPSRFLPEMPSGVDALVTKATERDPRYRLGDAGQFLAKMLEVLRQLPNESQAAPLPPVAQPSGATANVTAPQLIAGGTGPGTENSTMVVNLEETDFADDEHDEDPEDGGDSWLGRNRLLVIGGAVLALVVLAAGWWFLIGRYENVPEVTGDTPESAREAILEAGLSYDLSEDEVYSDEADPGTVGQTDPAPGERLSPGDEVTVQLSMGPQHVDMPDLVGEDASNAEKELEDLGFEPDSIVQEETDDENAPPGEVLSTDPEAEGTADREGTVTLTVSSGIPVPAVAGEDLEDARQTLEDLGLEVSVVEEASEDVDEGVVISQDPDSDTSVGSDTTIELTVSSGPPEVDVPDVTGMDIDDAVEELEDAGFEVTVDRIFGGNTIARQSPEGSAPEGSEVELIATPGGIDLGDDFDEDDLDEDDFDFDDDD